MHGGTTIVSYSYTVDPVGNRSQVADTTGTTTYGYDGLYRLAGTTYPNNDVQSYTYDAQGNRLTKVNNGNTTNYSYDDADQMTLAGGVSYAYDNDGNQTAARSDTFGWDAENRLTSTNIGGVASSYVYNGVGLRTSRTIGGTTTSYAWDLSSDLPQVLQDSSGNKYVYGLDLISQTDGSGNQAYFLNDGLGSTTGLSDGSGAVIGEYTYDVFGAVRTQTGSATEWSYTGEQNDPTGLEYLRARYYDASTGRFVSRDPLPLLQRYAYVGGNPANLMDPDGLWPKPPCPGCGKVRDVAHEVASAAETATSATRNYFSEPENVANLVQAVGGFGMVISCGAQDAAVPLAAVCVGSISLYAGGSIAKVYLADSNSAKACHAGAALIGAVPLAAIPGKAVAFVTGVTDEFCEPSTVYAQDDNSRHPKK